jgi:tetratricopeptide (TPR) repeat protein
MATSELLDKPSQVDVRHLVGAGRYVALVGRFASMSRAQAAEVIHAHGAQVSSQVRRGTSLVVVGQRDWLLNRDGMMPEALRHLRVLAARENAKTPVISEEQFLRELGLGDHAEQVHPEYSTTTLTELLGVSVDTVRGWVKAGLLEPAWTSHGVWYFDFRQATAAKTLCDLARRGVSLKRMRKSLEQLRAWLPEAEQPLEQLAVLERDGNLMVRLAEGSLAATDGQLVLDFDQPAETIAEEHDDEPRLRIGDHHAAALPQTLTRSASQWFELAVEQQAAGLLAEAVTSYHEALLAGGPDAQTCFDLAGVLHALGRRPESIERYRQAVEVDPRFTDAWNNLGTVLAEANRLDEACVAFRRALSVNASDMRAHYNLADTLDDMGLAREAAPHWKAFLRFDTSSQWAAHARKRLAAV